MENTITPLYEHSYCINKADIYDPDDKNEFVRITDTVYKENGTISRKRVITNLEMNKKYKEEISDNIGIKYNPYTGEKLITDDHLELHGKTYEEFIEDSLAIQKRHLINKASEQVEEIISDLCARYCETWDEESKRKTLDNFRKALEISE